MTDRWFDRVSRQLSDEMLALAKAEIADLERQLAEERARLDWIEKWCTVHVSYWYVGDAKLSPAPTLREAIDLERAK